MVTLPWTNSMLALLWRCWIIWQSGSFSNTSMNYRCCHLVPHLRATSVQSREIFVMVTKLKELISEDLRWGVIFEGTMNIVINMGRFNNQGGVAGIEYIKAFLCTKPTARRSGWTRILTWGRIWFGFCSKWSLNLQLKTVLYVGFWVHDESFKQYWMESFLLWM